MERSLSAQPATLNFTSDFHELLRGCFLPGHSVTLRYDPLRLVPPGDDYVFGDPARPVTAHIRFGASDAAGLVTLESPVGVLPDRQPDITGEGPMLTATIEIPADASEVEAWFTMKSADGDIIDSDNGVNYHFGFPRAQISVIKADVVAGTDNARFVLDVSAVDDIHRLVVRIHAAQHGAFPSFDADLDAAEDIGEGRRRWTLTDVSVPNGQILRFKLYYWIGDLRYKEDNDGLYYLAPPPPQMDVPPPPDALAAAAKLWA